MSPPDKKLLTAKPARAPRRLRVHEVTAEDTKTLILGAANVLAGIFGVFDALEKGELVGTAIRKEVRRGKRRAKAIREAEVSEEDP